MVTIRDAADFSCALLRMAIGFHFTTSVYQRPPLKADSRLASQEIC
jgi:hypothetical protein